MLEGGHSLSNILLPSQMSASALRETTNTEKENALLLCRVEAAAAGVTAHLSRLPGETRPRLNRRNSGRCRLPPPSSGKQASPRPGSASALAW